MQNKARSFLSALAELDREGSQADRPHLQKCGLWASQPSGDEITGWLLLPSSSYHRLIAFLLWFKGQDLFIKLGY